MYQRELPLAQLHRRLRTCTEQRPGLIINFLTGSKSHDHDLDYEEPVLAPCKGSGKTILLTFNLIITAETCC
jgi:hypothetical protein